MNSILVILCRLQVELFVNINYRYSFATVQHRLFFNEAILIIQA